MCCQEVGVLGGFRLLRHELYFKMPKFGFSAHSDCLSRNFCLAVDTCSDGLCLKRPSMVPFAFKSEGLREMIILVFLVARRGPCMRPSTIVVCPW